MTNDQINLALAKWEGWTSCEECREIHRRPFWKQEGKGGLCSESLPSYTTDLNAVWQLEEKLPTQNRKKYQRELDRICVMSSYWDLVHSTARQRAEALLRTLGLWKD